MKGGKSFGFLTSLSHEKNKTFFDIFFKKLIANGCVGIFVKLNYSVRLAW